MQTLFRRGLTSRVWKHTEDFQSFSAKTRKVILCAKVNCLGISVSDQLAGGNQHHVTLAKFDTPAGSIIFCLTIPDLTSSSDLDLREKRTSM